MQLVEPSGVQQRLAAVVDKEPAQTGERVRAHAPRVELSDDRGGVHRGAGCRLFLLLLGRRRVRDGIKRRRGEVEQRRREGNEHRAKRIRERGREAEQRAEPRPRGGRIRRPRLGPLHNLRKHRDERSLGELQRKRDERGHRGALHLVDRGGGTLPRRWLPAHVERAQQKSHERASVRRRGGLGGRRRSRHAQRGSRRRRATRAARREARVVRLGERLEQQAVGHALGDDRTQRSRGLRGLERGRFLVERVLRSLRFVTVAADGRDERG
mmetsp:Transcript_9671/g.44041  ORF Transcript_9671/g.44041 Transcript_9671/m.44041 type:complete len:269 (+) Transcript_9671:490-1296(+)